MFSSGPRPHSETPFLPFDEMPGRLIHRYASANGEPVFDVGWVPRPAFFGLHHFDFVPTAGFHYFFGSGPLAFSYGLPTKCLPRAARISISWKHASTCSTST